jgi:hypothetical protein
MGNDKQEGKPKSKLSFKELLFGANGAKGSSYHIIYFTMQIIMSEKGPEQVIFVLYGDGTSIFTNVLPVGSVMFSYNKETNAPMIKLNKGSLFGGGAKAEILLPQDYSFMAPSVPFVIDQMPQPIIQQAVSRREVPNDRFDFDIAMRQAQQSIQADQENGIEIPMGDKTEENMTGEIATPDEENNSSLETGIIQRPNKKDQGDVIEDADPFKVTFDQEILAEKINKFLQKQEAKKEEQKDDKPKLEGDGKSIEEVKREEAENEIERLQKNDEQIHKLEREASNDANTGTNGTFE